MNCSDFRLLIPFRRTGDLLPEDLGLLEAHLSACPACASLAAPLPVDAAIQNAFQTVDLPAGLKQRVGIAVTSESRSILLRRIVRSGVLVSILALLGLMSWGIYNLTRPKLDSEAFGYWNTVEADPASIHNLVFTWLESEKIPTRDLPFDFADKYFVAKGYEKIDGNYVPFLKFQDQEKQMIGSFAKVYFIRNSAFDVKSALDYEGSVCSVLVVKGSNGLTYLIVHTGVSPEPFVKGK
ncbi:MAG: hypothetical protein U0798_08180 [Gemmataceae bacterium]